MATAGVVTARTVARRTVAGLLAVVMAPLLAACTDDGAPAPGASTAAAAPASPSATPVEEPRLGPLDALLVAVSQVGTETHEAQLARLLENEEIVAACMAEQGFEYEPMDWAAILELQWAREAEWDEPVPALDPADAVEAARTYGYGLFTTPEEPEDPAGDGAVVQDPNDERVAQMSQAEERAWYLALWGPGQGEAYIAEEEPYDWTKYGCSGVAAHELGTDVRESFDDSPWADLREQIYALRDGLDADPALEDVRQGWMACMEDQGHPGYTGVREPLEEMQRRSAEIWEQASVGVELDLSTDDYLTDPAYLQQQADIAALQAEMAPVEIELAVADMTCRAEVGYDERLAQLWLDRQEEFYEAHRADLEAWLAAAQEFDARQP
ncbi:hypothetical protein N867_09550 [Actinotalea fermentans ATCC 43279 = JCM 9966 = DSM 3133]|nr:hypothetical protein N867_09550 [Actinotalea fermentans ATCC 43279 = JCM 9966 = DSM 3133]